MRQVSTAVCIVATLLFAWVFQYLFQPTLNLSFIDPYMTLAFILGFAGLATLVFQKKDAPVLLFAGAVVVLAVGFGFSTLSSLALFRADAYREQLGAETTEQISTSLPPLRLDQAPLVSPDMAERAAEKSLAAYPTLGSQVTLSYPTKQIVDGKLVYVSFMQPRDVFKYWKDGYTPGYVIVSASDASRVELVTQLHGKPLKMLYLIGSYFSHSVYRHLYQGGYRTTGLTDYSEELDDEGNPYYVVTLYRHSIGFDGDEATGVATVDVQTGEIKEYGINSAPAWIDRIQPQRFIKEQAANRGYYANGWFNPSDTNRTEVSAVDLVYAADGHADYYVGLTSVGQPGLIGFLLVDSRTKKVRHYVISGAAENAAIAAAEGVYPEKRYTATQALPFMLNSTPTYAMTLRDATGIARGYALVSMRNINTVTIGDTLQAASRQYQMKLGQDRTAVQASSAVTTQKLTGTVVLFGSDTRNGNTLYYFTLDSAPGRIYMGSTDVSVELALTKAGQKVSVEYQAGDSQLTNLTSFKNLDVSGVPATVAAK